MRGRRADIGLVVAIILATSSHRIASADDPPSGSSTPRSVRLVDGTTRQTRAVAKGAVALVFCSAECPISNGYSPTLINLVKEFPADRVTLIGVFVDPDLSSQTLTEHAKEYALNFPVAIDRSGTLARSLGVKVTPEVVVLNDADRICYVGRIDDQYAARGKVNANPSTHELRDAIRAVLDGREPAKPRVAAVGCPLPEPPKAGTEPAGKAGR